MKTTIPYLRVLLLTAATMLLAACSSPQAIPSPDEMAPLFTDSDIASAELDLPDTIEAITASDVGVMPDGAEKDEGALSPQAVLPNSGGYLVYARFNHLNAKYEIWRANQTSDAKTLIYSGLKHISDVALSLDGNSFFFTAVAEDNTLSSLNGDSTLLPARTISSNQYELYKFVASTKKLTRLTKTYGSETSVSVSANGRTVVWEGVDPLSVDRRAIFIREFSTGGASDSVFVLTSSDYQGNPMVSSDGKFIAFIRTASGKNRVMLYNKLNKTYSQVASSSQTLYSPSPGNGKKVAWIDSYLDSSSNTYKYRVRVKNLSSGSVTTAVTEDYYILTAHLPANGDFLSWLAYRLTSGGDSTYPVFTKNLSTNQVATAVAGSTAARLDDIFWQR